MIVEPEAWQQAEQEFHQIHRGSYRGEEVTQFIFFSLIVKELRQQNELLKTLQRKPESTLETDPKFEAWRKTHPEGRELFPVMEMEMREDSLKISLADDQAILKAELPKALVDTILTWWQGFQNGTETEEVVMGRWYMGPQGIHRDKHKV